MIQSILDWCSEVVSESDVVSRDILEVGSYNVNGSFRPYIESLNPSTYTGVDQLSGPDVDVIGKAEHLVNVYGPASFDVVISTEMLEHCEHWHDAVWNMMEVTKPGGLHIISTRSPGFPWHPYPEDWWRFSLDDIRAIWSSWDILDARDDPEMPGVFIKARKRHDWDSLLDYLRLTSMTVYRQPQL